MAQPQDHISMALFCDFENVAIGVRDANYEKFDIKRVLERLLLKGSIVVKKAYCDWDRYRQFKGTMHEANFELIEIPHVRQSGKNSADIRMVVDALDLCYTKSHVNTFVIISGDSDFSPLVSKLRENAKYVIGVGVKQSTSDLLIANCDEFIFYDDLVRESQRQRNQGSRDQQPQQRRSPEEEKRRREEMDARRTKVVEMAAETYEALVTDRDEGGRVWASVLKEALKRRNPGFSEQYYGFRTFGNLLEEAQARGLLDLGRDEKSGLFVMRGNGVALRADAATMSAGHEAAVAQMPGDMAAMGQGEEASGHAQHEAAAPAAGAGSAARETRSERGERGDRGERGERAERGERGGRSRRGGRGNRGGGRNEEGGTGSEAPAATAQAQAPGAQQVAQHSAQQASPTPPPAVQPPPAPQALRPASPVDAAAAPTSSPAAAEAAPAAKGRKTAGKTANKTASKTSGKTPASKTAANKTAASEAASSKVASKKAATRSPRTPRQPAAKKADEAAS